MPTFIPRNPDREAKFSEWKDKCQKNPDDYKIEIRGNGDCMVSHLMRKADDQWYSIAQMPQWDFKHEDFFDA